MRLLLYTGKGGVGKTSIAAATAFSLAKAGQRGGILSTDAAHRLGDSCEVSIGTAPGEGVPGLMARDSDA
ncbi:MAG: ArsA-related P-loop ATPase, partial [Eubacterium sp.]